MSHPPSRIPLTAPALLMLIIVAAVAVLVGLTSSSLVGLFNFHLELAATGLAVIGSAVVARATYRTSRAGNAMLRQLIVGVFAAALIPGLLMGTSAAFFIYSMRNF